MTQVKIINELKAEITDIEKYNGNQIEQEFQKVSNQIRLILERSLDKYSDDSHNKIFLKHQIQIENPQNIIIDRGGTQSEPTNSDNSNIDSEFDEMQQDIRSHE